MLSPPQGADTVLGHIMDIICMTNIGVVISLLHFTKEEITITAHNHGAVTTWQGLATHFNRTSASLTIGLGGKCFYLFPFYRGGN